MSTLQAIEASIETKIMKMKYIESKKKNVKNLSDRELLEYIYLNCVQYKK